MFEPRTWFAALFTCVLGMPGAMFAQGGIHVGNGGGLAESNVAYAMVHLGGFMGECVRQPQVCAVSSEARELLVAISGNLAEERREGEPIEFRTAADVPGFFVVNGRVVEARTDPRVGAMIFINRDLLYPLDDAGDPVPVGVAHAVRLLVTQFAVHLAAAAPPPAVVEEAAQACARLSRRAQETIAWGTLGIHWIPPEERPTVTVVNSGDAAARVSRVYMSDMEKALDVTDVVAKTLRCPARSDGSVPQVIGFRATNLHWRVQEIWNDEPLVFGMFAVPVCDGRPAARDRVTVGASLLRYRVFNEETLKVGRWW
jgi:hypothetical protein